MVATAVSILSNWGPAASVLTLLVGFFLQILAVPKARQSRLVIHTNRRRVVTRYCLVICALLVINIGIAVGQGALGYRDASFEDRLFYCLCSLMLWSCISIAIHDVSNPPALPFIAFWAIYAAEDLALTGLSFDALAERNVWVISHCISQIIRSILILAILIYTFHQSRDDAFQTNAEQERLLAEDDSDSEHQTEAPPETYGTLSEGPSDSSGGDSSGGEDDEDDDDDEYEREVKEMQQKRLADQGSWLGYLRGFAIFLPYIFPYHDRFTQAWLLLLTACVVIMRVLMVMVPYQLGKITEELGNIGDNGSMPWLSLLFWGLLQFPIWTGTELVQGLARTRISQFAYAHLKAAAFTHVMSLSMDYHSFKSSGKLTKAIEQGTDLTSLVDNFFTVIPTFIDLVIATIYLTAAFDRFMGLIVVATTVTYVCLSLKKNFITSKMERVSAEKQRVESEVLYDSVTNWQLVAYNNRRKFEAERYSTAVRGSVMSQRRYYDWSDYAFFLQNSTLDIGLLVAATLACYKVVTGASPLSSFVFLVMYWTAVKEPMSIIAWTFHESAAHLINAEWLFQLLQTKTSIVEKEGAPVLDVKKGRVEFENVGFFYMAERPILQGVSFVAEPGQTVALVGQTGGGKSTILKLLYRFYDVNNGAITIDGQDIRDVTLDSLRESLGIVPQDPSVFDQTILQNILYARPFATMDEVYEACRAAHIHDQILTFPRGYHTRIGERGVRLSGGELQRLAIARVILRRPSIVVLDEATSAVDSATEVAVQEALRTLSAGRTVFVVAHRLSTVVKADKILVLDGGKIAECGTHAELLQEEGAYARLWGMQTGCKAEDVPSEQADADAEDS